MRCTAQHITLESPAGHSKWGNHLEETSPSSERWVWAAPRTSWTSWVLSSSLGRAPWWSLWRSTCCSSCWAGTGGTSPPAGTCSAGSAGNAPRSCHTCAESGNSLHFIIWIFNIHSPPFYRAVQIWWSQWRVCRAWRRGWGWTTGSGTGTRTTAGGRSSR